MSNSLSENDRELSEPPFNNGTETITAEGHIAPGHGAQFNPLNAKTGTMTNASSNNDELKAGKVSRLFS